MKKVEAMKTNMSLSGWGCSGSRKRKNNQSEDEKRKNKKKKKLKIQTLKQETIEQGDEAIKSDMSLRGCSSSRKRKKNNQSQDEKGKNKKKKQQPTLKKKNKRKKKKKKGDMVNLFHMRFGSFLTPKKEKKKTQSYSFVDDPRYLQCIKTHNQERQLKGKTINLSELLFTKHRDFLITYNDRNRPVQAKHLEGKVIVLHFVSLVSPAEHLTYRTTILLDMYQVLQPKGGFEVVFIGVPVDTAAASNPDTLLLHESTLEKNFEDIFSLMPWTAIPFSDIKSREYWESIFPISGALTDYHSKSYVIDPTGMILQCYADKLFCSYGARAYPFTNERMECIASEDHEAWKRPSITKLLASPERDFLINKDNQVVPLHYLEDKVVGLYFYEDYSADLTSTIQTAYEQLAREKNFEIVFVYIHDALISFKHTSENSYWKKFREMPWLALPFKDPVCKKLQLVFNYPMDAEGGGPDPRLSIIGPQGKYVERYGADILKHYGISAYPFTRKRVAELEAKKMKELKLNMFWGPNISLTRKDGSTVQLSQLVGKRIILVVEKDQYCPNAKFWRMLRARYLQMKGTNDEFEVIHICRKEGYSYGNNIATMSWLRLPAFCARYDGCRSGGEFSARDNGSRFGDCFFLQGVGLFAFDRDGTVIRRTKSRLINGKNMGFPFNSGGLKEEMRKLEDWYQWEPWSFHP